MSFKKALGEITHAKIFFDQPMKKLTGYGVGGCARYYAEVDSLYALNDLISLAKQHRVRYKVIGNGTNLLVSDLGYNGLIISIKGLSDVFFKRDQVRAMAGARLDKLIKFALDHKLSGLESLAGIPATVGGAIVMNAGAFGHNISDCITTIETLNNGKIKIYDKRDANFAYRTSRFLGKKEVVISADFCFKNEDREKILSSMKTYLEIRKKMHPTERSCGSVFKNPKPYSAGSLIERAGLKNFTIGGATVSDKHANFVVVNPKARAKDVYLVIQHVKGVVKDKFNVELDEEVEYVGEF